ncbi:MAG: CsgG/HfaB family protein [Desulfobacterales bacterium]|jgi:galactitol-specific phosphotransferase system IIB component
MIKKVPILLITLVATIVFGTAAPTACFARLTYVTVESEGSGSSSKAAVYDAITQALGKVNGMQIATQTTHAIAEASVETNEDDAYFASEAFGQQIQSATKGTIKKYNVLSLDQNPDMNDLWFAKIEVTIAKYKVSKQAQRLRMALVPFRINPQVSSSKKAVKFEKLFAQALVSYLTQTRKFAILDREFMKEQNLELDLIQGANFSLDEMSRLGNKLGTDYMIVGAVDDVIDKRWTQTMKTTGKKFAMHKFGTQISFRIIDVATGQVKFSDMYNQGRKSQGKEADYMVFARKAADSVGQKIINAIYPVVVSSVRGKKVYLAQGGDTLKVGQKMELIKYGEPVLDPYTNESLGKEEIQIGMVQVTTVQAKLAQAKIITSSIDLAAEFSPKSFIVRPIKGKTQSIAKRQAKVKKALKKDFEEFEKNNDDDW